LDSANNHIFELLQSFSDQELKKFKTFLDSPYFNSNKKVILLFNEIMKYFPLFNNSNLANENMFKIIYEVEGKNKSNIRLLYSELLHLAMDFIHIERYSKDKYTSIMMLLHELNDRKQNKLFNVMMKRIENKTTEIIDADFFMYKYQIENQKYNNLKINCKILKTKSPLEHVNISIESNKYLTLYFVTEIISDYVNLKIHSLKFNIAVEDTYTIKLIKSLNLEQIKSALNRDYKYTYIIEIYNNLYKMFYEVDNHENFKNYKSMIDNCKGRLSNKEKQFHYANIINYLILMDLKHSEKKEYSQELFNVYKYFLSNKLYLNDKTDYLPESLYRAILLLALRLNQIHWVKNYIDEFTPLVHPKEKNNLFVYAYSLYYFSINQFEKSLEYLNRVNYDYFIYKFDAKILLIKIYYELEYFEEALSTIHTLKELLRTDSFFSDEIKIQYCKFLKFVKHLVLHREESVKDFDFDLFKLTTSQDIIHKDWLLEKYYEFEKVTIPSKKSKIKS
jgi:hypothetical protein